MRVDGGLRAEQLEMCKSGRYGEGGGGSGWGTHAHPWWIHVDVWQNQYNIVK